jgi:transposase InsO family protein
MRISMGEIGNCYENAMAERINGILKNEFNLDATFKNIESAKKITQQAIDIYNNKRPHLALKMKKPSELYAA